MCYLGTQYCLQGSKSQGERLSEVRGLVRLDRLSTRCPLTPCVSHMHSSTIYTHIIENIKFIFKILTGFLGGGNLKDDFIRWEKNLKEI